ncbi:MAG: hydroxyacid dehydrogenase [Firmicutes bacterium HGW-Firmicutes-7]|nr:MAG: hydroxyacid dehydrogenase [Firmicutes bacterium HGW-Firmicutes-7]
MKEAKKIGASVVRGNCKSEDEVIDIAKDADALLVNLAPITESVIESLDRCQVVVRYGIGVDNVDIQAATKAGIYVVNVPNYCIDEVSSHAAALVLAITRKLLQFDKDIKSGIWDFQQRLPIIDLRKSILGVVGFGNIARLFIKKMKVFGIEQVLVYDPFVKNKDIKEFCAIPVEFDELVTTSDIISLHTPLTQDTRHLFGEAQFRKIKKTTCIVNTARGGIIDEQALYIALKEGLIAGAALDTMELEPPKVNNPLFELDNVILTPHVAFYSEAAIKNLHLWAIEEAIRVLAGGIPKNIVNQGIISEKRQ